MRTKEEWEREVEALWIEAAHAFFLIGLIVTCVDPELGNPDSPNCYVEDIEKVNPEQLKGPYYAGLDVGKQVHFNVLIVVQQMESGEVKLIHKRQFPLRTPYPDVVAYVATAHQVSNFQDLFVDKTGVGDVIADELEAIEGLRNVKGVFLTDVEKENMPNRLKLLMEKKLLRILGDEDQLIT